MRLYIFGFVNKYVHFCHIDKLYYKNINNSKNLGDAYF